MEPEDIKVGDCYPVLAHVGYMNKKGNYGITINWGDGLMETRSLTPADACAMFSIYETKPKHDPCRKLKVGDVVRVLKIHGNLPKCKWAGNIPKEGVTGIVRELRKEDNFVWVDCKEIFAYCIDPVYLELVTPVEELEPYIIKDYADFYAVEKDGAQYSIFFKGSYHDKTKEAADAECKRLNEEYRKEQK